MAGISSKLKIVITALCCQLLEEFKEWQDLLKDESWWLLPYVLLAKIFENCYNLPMLKIKILFIMQKYSEDKKYNWISHGLTVNKWKTKSLQNFQR